VALWLSARRQAIRRATDRVLDVLHDHDPAEVIVLTLGFVMAAVAPFIVVMLATPARQHEGLPVDVDRIQRSPRGPVDYTNVAGGYGFSYPPMGSMQHPRD
jgi:hypothetical protein